MASLALMTRSGAELATKKNGVKYANRAAHHACLMAEYMSYMESAGYSLLAEAVRERRQGASRFLAKFPDPYVWLALPPAEQLRSDSLERSFVHYLFLRRLLPMPQGYMLLANSFLCDMGIRLMEREAFERYAVVARRLGYRELAIRRQFRALLFLMSWAQKPMDALALADLDDFAEAMRKSLRAVRTIWRGGREKNGLPQAWDAQLKTIRGVLYHLGVLPQRTSDGRRALSFEKQWQSVSANNAATVRRYLQQVAASLRPGTVKQERSRLFQFFSWLSANMPGVTQMDQIERCHIEAFKEHLRWAPLKHRSNRTPGLTLSSWAMRNILTSLYHFFNNITLWDWPEAPGRTLMFAKDLPPLDQPLPRFLDEMAAARFLQAARGHPDLFTRVCGVTLLLTGMRQSEFLGLTLDCMVQIGDNHWLRVPLGKTHQDRYIPLSPEVKGLLDEWIRQTSTRQTYDFLFTQYGRRMARSKVALAVGRIGEVAGIKEHIPPHRLRHTLATMAVNRGMPLESIAALLGHRSLSMTMTYARIGKRTVQQEYAKVSQRLEELCNMVALPNVNGEAAPPTIAEGSQMRRLRRDHWRLLGNGYCSRPEGVPCEYETICESCTCFSTTVEFLPVLEKQRQDAQTKGQAQRAQVFARLIARMGDVPML